jgi:hypothetical protein
MKRCITCLGWGFGSTLLVALAIGCRANRPAEAPPAGPTSPTFESSMPGAPGEQAAPEMAPTPEVGEAPGPGAQKPQPAEQPAAPPAEHERQLCDALSGHAKLHVEDVHNGVAIVATPKNGQNLSTVRDDAQRISTALHEHAAEPGPGAEACGLFSMGRMPGVNTTVTETANTVRIMMTTPHAAEVKDLRRIAREQVGAMTKPPKGR